MDLYQHFKADASFYAIYYGGNWQTMPHEGEALMAADYPKYNEKYAYPQAEAEMHRIMERSALSEIGGRK